MESAVLIALPLTSMLPLTQLPSLTRLAFASLLLFAASQLDAVPVNPLSYQASVYHADSGGSATYYSYTPGPLSYLGANVSSALTPAPTLEATATVQGDGHGVVSSSLASVTYSFIISGPAETNVPVLVDAFGSVAVSWNSVASVSWGVDAQFQIHQLGTSNVAISQALRLDLYNPSQASNSFRIFDTYNFQSNTEYRVTMLTHTNVSALGGSDSATARAFVDPVFTIGGANANLFSLTFSDGIGNARTANGVPDMGQTATLLAFGLLGLTALRRRRV